MELNTAQTKAKASYDRVFDVFSDVMLCLTIGAGAMCFYAVKTASEKPKPESLREFLEMEKFYNSAVQLRKNPNDLDKLTKGDLKDYVVIDAESNRQIRFSFLDDSTTYNLEGAIKKSSERIDELRRHPEVQNYSSFLRDPVARSALPWLGVESGLALVGILGINFIKRKKDIRIRELA